MKNFLIIPLTLLMSSSAFAAESMQPDAVVELFTSQGCSSCPPANEFVAKLAEDQEKLVLSYGVTYWDYLGWKDTFGDPEFTKRQRAYGKSMGVPNVYTPQIVLNGSTHSPRYSLEDVETMSLPFAKAEASLILGENGLEISAEGDLNARLILVSFTPGEQVVPVKRGENSGRALKLANVVTDVASVDWNGSNVKTEIMPKEGQAYAALFHDSETAKIVSAAVYYP